MCGIAGLIRPGSEAASLRRTASGMAASLDHRGPDDDGVWVDATAGVGLGHRRLAVIDLSAEGHQPMISASGRYVIVYNGEVYNFPDLSRELTAAGVIFRGHSDTEVILAAIEHWGLEAALQRFVGMFAFALWDCRDHELVLVRDRLGIKPLYWGRFGSLFLFGSELKALLSCDAWPRRIERDALAAFLRWNYVPSPTCIYAGVAKVPPGHLLRMRPGQEPTSECYWDFRAIAISASDRRQNLAEGEAVDAFEAVLGEAVASRMIADVPLGAFLSGGIDSTTIVALMQAQSAQPVRTFTIGFGEDEFDEAPHARAVARHLGTEHNELYIDPDDALSLVSRLAGIHDEPFADPSQIPTYFVSEMTRRHVTVALSGDGGDELFAGYTRYRWADLAWRHLGRMPRPLRATLGSLIATVPGPVWRGAAALLPAARQPGRLAERAVKVAALCREADANGIYRRLHSHWPNPDAIVIGGSEGRNVTWDASLAAELPDFVERMQFFDTVTYLPDDILTKVDRASMAVSLEARVPMLDHRVVEAAWSLPRQLRRRGGVSKWLLRSIAARHVPEALLDRPKKGFAVPLAAWLRGPLREWAGDLLAADRLGRQGYLEPAPIQRLWQDFLAGRPTFHDPLWGVLMFQSWLECYDGKRPA